MDSDQGQPYHPNNLLNRGIDSESFVGRADDCTALHTLLQTVEPPNLGVVVGMPGVGKTELAIQYGRSHLADYPGGVAWFAAENFGKALQDWMQVEFCPDRDLRALATEGQRLKVAWKEWSQFCGGRPALVMVDDVTDYRQQVEPYLPQTLTDDSPFRFLLISRVHLVSPTPIPTQEIQELELDAAVALLARFAGSDRIAADRPTAEIICQRLARLPLALTLAGCWLGLEVDRTLTELITSLEREGLEAPALERDRDMVRLTAERGLKAAFAISWQQLERRGTDGPQLARLLTLLAPVDIPWELVTAVVATYDQLNPVVVPPAHPPAPTGWRAVWQRIWQTIWHPIRRWLGLQPASRPLPPSPVPIADAATARQSLQRLSLLQGVDRTAKRYRLHPLLREFFSQQWQTEHDREGWSLALAHTINDYASQIPSDMGWEQAAAFNFLQPQLPIAQQIWQDRAKTSPDADTRARYRRQADAIRVASFRLSQTVQFATSFERARKTHEQAKAALAAGNQRLAQQYFVETRTAYLNAIEQARKTLPADSFQLVGYLCQTATLFYELGHYGDGIPLAEEAVAIITNRANPTTLAAYLNDLALLHHYQGNYNEAEPLYERSLSIVEQQLGADHPHVAASLNNLAALYEAMGRYGEAEPLYERSLTIKEQQLGADHPDVATSLNSLAGLYQAMGRYGEAEPLYGRSLTIRKQQLGADHPHVATTMNDLANLYQSTGRYKEAEPLLLNVVEIYQKQLGENHSWLATSLNNLAGLYYTMGRYGEAEPLYGRSLSIREQQLGADHPAVAQSLNNLAGLYELMGRYGEAEPLYGRSLTIREQQFGSDHPDVAQSLNNLALLYNAMGRYGEAEPLYLRALNIWPRKLPLDHPRNKLLRENFEGMVQAALAAGQADQLSAHPTTQAVLEQLRQGSDPARE